MSEPRFILPFQFFWSTLPCQIIDEGFGVESTLFTNPPPSIAPVSVPQARVCRCFSNLFCAICKWSLRSRIAIAWGAFHL